MYDELVKSLRDCAKVNSLSLYKRGLMKQAADAIDELLQKTQQLPRWIPVTERLPEERDNYLVLTEELENYVCDFIPSVKQWWTVPGDKFLIDVTHWMSLPEPTKEKT